MTDIELLKKMICDEAVVPLQVYRADNRWKATLKEEKGKCYFLDVLNIPEDTVVIKSDAFPDTRHFFQGTYGENKRADFILVSTIKKRIVFIELKAGKAGAESELEGQLKGAMCLMDYCRLLGEAFLKKRTFLAKSRYQYRFVSICNLSISKKPSRSEKTKAKHDTPEKMLKLSSPHHVQFGQLI